MANRIHIITFQVPYPADYGGVIDIYYKAKALKEAGYNVVLHCFAYKGRDFQKELLDIADEVYVYKRNTCWLNRLGIMPYIVKSRKSKELLVRLQKDDAPILFEGLHTCYYLDSPLLKDRKKFVRAHNVESDYYYYLSGTTISIKKKIFFLVESWRLKRYENILKSADIIFSITEKDRKYFANRFPNTDVRLLPCFHNGADDIDPTLKKGSGKYLLYHGNLSVEENINAVYYLAERIIPRMPTVKWVIAGNKPPQELYDVVKELQNVTVVPNPSIKKMTKLITEANANVLITFQSTGIKLKLLNALYKGGFCIVNDKMTESTGVGELCRVTHSDSDLVNALNEVFGKKYDEKEEQKRIELLNKYYNNEVNIKILAEAIDNA